MEQMVADLLTKPISRDRFEALSLRMGLGDFKKSSGSAAEVINWTYLTNYCDVIINYSA